MRKKKYTKQQFYRRLEAQNANRAFPVLKFKCCLERFAKAADRIIKSFNDFSKSLEESYKKKHFNQDIQPLKR